MCLVFILVFFIDRMLCFPFRFPSRAGSSIGDHSSVKTDNWKVSVYPADQNHTIPHFINRYFMIDSTFYKRCFSPLARTCSVQSLHACVCNSQERLPAPWIVGMPNICLFSWWNWEQEARLLMQTCETKFWPSKGCCKPALNKGATTSNLVKHLVDRHHDLLKEFREQPAG